MPAADIVTGLYDPPGGMLGGEFGGEPGVSHTIECAIPLGISSLLTKVTVSPTAMVVILGSNAMFCMVIVRVRAMCAGPPAGEASSAGRSGLLSCSGMPLRVRGTSTRPSAADASSADLAVCSGMVPAERMVMTCLTYRTRMGRPAKQPTPL